MWLRKGGLMKKSLIFILILTLAVAFTACTSKPPEETTPQTTVNTEPAETTPVDEFTPENDYSVLVYSSPELSDDETYSIYSGEIKIADSSSGMYGGGPGGPGDHGMMPPDRPGY